MIAAGTAATKGRYAREKEGLRRHQIGRTEIYGQDGFVNKIREAILLLRTAYPYGYLLVQRYIHAIVQSDARRGMGGYLGVIFHPDTPGRELSISPSRLAASLVRHAIGFRKFLGFQITRSPRSELHSLNRELHAMRLLRCDPKYFHGPSNRVLQIEKKLRDRPIRAGGGSHRQA
jgi:hypothetical protein